MLFAGTRLGDSSVQNGVVVIIARSIKLKCGEWGCGTYSTELYYGELGCGNYSKEFSGFSLDDHVIGSSISVNTCKHQASVNTFKHEAS